MAERLIFRKLELEEKMEIAKLLSRAVEDESGFHPTNKQEHETTEKETGTENNSAQSVEILEP